MKHGEHIQGSSNEYQVTIQSLDIILGKLFFVDLCPLFLPWFILLH